MDLVQDVLPLLGVVLGAFLSGVGTYFKHRADRKRVVARALSDLLEIRHRFAGVENILRELNKHANVPVEATEMLRVFFMEVLEVDEATLKRFQEAVNELAGVDPVLAFRLRSKDQVPNLIGSIGALANRFGASAEQVSQVDPMLREIAIPALDEAVLELAEHHSSRTKREVQKLISRPFKLPPDLLAKLKSLEA